QSLLVGAQKDPFAFWFTFDIGIRAEGAGLAGLADGLARRGATLTSVVSELPEEKQKLYTETLARVFADFGKRAGDPKRSPQDRATAISIVASAPWQTARDALVPLVEKESTTELRIAALRALAAQQDKEVPDLLMKLWSGASPSIRREILEAMLRQ